MYETKKRDYRLLFLDNGKSHNPWFFEILKKERNYEAELVTTKKQYDAGISSEKYDLALFADLHIHRTEETNGEFCKPALEILADLRKKRIPVLILSIERKKIDEQARNLGARVLRKPLPLPDILRELEMLENAIINECNEDYSRLKKIK